MNASEIIGALVATGMTQYGIAKASGIPQPTISRIMSGQPDCLASTLEKLRDLARQKGVDVSGTAAAA